MAFGIIRCLAMLAMPRQSVGLRWPNRRGCERRAGMVGELRRGRRMFCSAMISRLHAARVLESMRVSCSIRADGRGLGRGIGVAEHPDSGTLATPSCDAAALRARYSQRLCPSSVAIAAGAKLLWEAAIFRHLLLRRLTALKRSALFIGRASCGSFTLARFAAGLLGGLIDCPLLLSAIIDRRRPRRLAAIYRHCGNARSSLAWLANCWSAICSLRLVRAHAAQCAGTSSNLGDCPPRFLGLETDSNSLTALRGNRPWLAFERSRRFERHGPLSDELALIAGKFGLGMVPAGLHPDAVARSVCGFCSTGCSWIFTSERKRAVGLTPTVDYPVNLGMACPKGWEALTVLNAPNRATTPLVRRLVGPHWIRSTWDLALRTFADRMKSIQAAHGPLRSHF